MYTIKLVKKHLNETIDVEGVVLTMKDNRSNLGQSVAEDINKYFINEFSLLLYDRLNHLLLHMNCSHNLLK